MNIVDKMKDILKEVECLALDEKIAAINAIRAAIHEISPFAGEPVDYVKWVKADGVIANKYNPNIVASPELELLYLSIKADGFTQPIVSYPERDYRLVVDGFHRSQIEKTHKDIEKRLHGYLPIVSINKSLEDRMASTIRHNRARGKHKVGSMADLVVTLSQEGWADGKIAKHLGMEAEEVLRLQQQAGIADYYKSRQYSRSWEWVPSLDDEEELAAGEDEEDHA